MVVACVCICVEVGLYQVYIQSVSFMYLFSRKISKNVGERCDRVVLLCFVWASPRSPHAHTKALTTSTHHAHFLCIPTVSSCRNFNKKWPKSTRQTPIANQARTCMYVIVSCSGKKNRKIKSRAHIIVCYSTENQIQTIKGGSWRIQQP